MPLISIVIPCFNEKENVRAIHSSVVDILGPFPKYRFEYIFIDNASTDGTQVILREMAREYESVKVILNTRNFGHIRSPFHGLLQAQGDAAILMACDFQDPPELLREFISQWEAGCKVVVGVKTAADESFVMFSIRKAYYDLVNRLAEVALTKNTTGFGLYDRTVLDTLRAIDDPYPYFRGLISDLGYKTARVEFHQPGRRRGVTKNNFYTLYDIAMLGIVNHSKVPLRLATITGFALSALCMAVALAYLCAKIIFWDRFSLGIAPILISLFLFSSIQLFFLGILGEYIGAILTQVQKRPLVIESERINLPAGPVRQS